MERAIRLYLYVLGGVKVESHLAYADDVSFYCLCRFSGLEVSSAKSYVVFPAKVEDGAQLGFRY